MPLRFTGDNAVAATPYQFQEVIEAFFAHLDTLEHSAGYSRRMMHLHTCINMELEPFMQPRPLPGLFWRLCPTTAELHLLCNNCREA